MPLRPLFAPPDSRGFGLRLVALLIAGFVIVVVSNIVSVTAIGQLAEQTDLVEHSRDVRQALDRVERALGVAESAQRGFLLTGDPTYDRREAAARQEAAEAVGALRELVEDDPAQVGRLAAIQPLIDERLALTEQAVRDAREGRWIQAVAVVRAGRGADLMRQVGDRLDELGAAEQSLLDERARAAERVRRLSQWLNIGGALLVVLIGLLSLFLIARYIGALLRARSALDEANRDLEDRVRTRTTELRAANAELRRARDRAEAMLSEVNHRVGNSLQLVASFIALQGRRMSDEAARNAFKATQGRIEAVSQVHRRLYTSGDMEHVALDDYLEGLAEELRQSLCSGEGACSITVEAASIKAPTNKAVSLGVLVAELVTNAVKYAYPSGEPGEIRVKLARAGKGRATLTVEDDGVGLSGKAPKGTGLGAVIVGAMAKDLKSEIAYEARSPGLKAVLVFAV